jgi:hypothetical protein
VNELESNIFLETAKFGSPACFLEYEVLFCVYGATKETERMKRVTAFKGRHVHHMLVADP